MNNPLTDILPAAARKYVYAILWLAALAIAVYKATQGDWLEFTASMLAALGFGTAQSNTHPEE